MSSQQLPVLSPDGTQRWDGRQWVPYEGALAARPAGPPPKSRSGANQLLAGLILCVIAGAVFTLFATLDPAFTFFMIFTLLCLIGAVIFAIRLATTKQCQACGMGIPESASACRSCGAPT